MPAAEAPTERRKSCGNCAAASATAGGRPPPGAALGAQVATVPAHAQPFAQAEMSCVPSRSEPPARAISMPDEKGSGATPRSAAGARLRELKSDAPTAGDVASETPTHVKRAGSAASEPS
jgi:hypothetical protein